MACGDGATGLGLGLAVRSPNATSGYIREPVGCWYRQSRNQKRGGSG